MKSIIKIEIDWSEGFTPNEEQIEDAKISALVQVTLEGANGGDIENGTFSRYEWEEGKQEEKIVYVLVGESAVRSYLEPDTSNRDSEVASEIMDTNGAFVVWNSREETISSFLDSLNGWIHWQIITKEDYEKISSHVVLPAPKIFASKFFAWYFSEGSDVLQFGDKIVTELKATGESSVSIRELFDSCGYIPNYICEGDYEQEEYDPSELEFINDLKK